MNDRRGLLAASVISIQNSCFVYPSCQNCFSKLILDSRRFNCLKCGCAGEAKDANYRYRLSLKVADANDLFHITVFGTCLDPFFGITAGRLQRCIQEAEGADRDESSHALIQAVKTCFIGRRLIFGLKGSKHQDGGPFASDSIFQNCSRINSQTKDLTACQLFLPNTAVAGFTVISYFHRLWQSTDIRHSHSSSYSPDSPLIAIDQPMRELNSSCSSCFVQSSRESFSGPWQQSFGLTSSSVDWVTAEDVLALEPGEDPGKWNKQEDRPFSAEPCSIIPSNETVLRVELYNSSRGERHEQKDHEFSSPHQQPDTDKLESISSLKRDLSTPSSHSRLLHNSLEFEVKRYCPGIASRYDKYQEKSRNSVFHQRQDYSFWCSSLSPDPSNTARVSEDDPMIWDELPFSESLNEFIARIENNKSVEPSIDSATHKYSLLENDKGNKNLAKSSQGTVAADVHAVCAAGVSSHLQENMNTCQEPVLSCHRSNLKPVSSKALQHKSLCSLLSTNIKEDNGSCFIANPPLLVQTQCSPVILKPYSEGSFLHSKEANITLSKSVRFPTNLKSPVEHGESPYLQKRQKHAHLRSIYGCLANWENKENSVYPPNQRTDLTSCWATGCSSAALSSTKITGKRELKPLTDLQQKTCRAVNERDLRNGSCPEGSYNASADLFDATGGDKEIAIDFLSKSYNSSAKDYVLTEKHTASELVLSPFDDGCSYSQCQLFLHSSSPAFSKHSTPISYSLCKSELDTVGTPDLVPYSQSTPVARPLQKLRPYRERDSIFPKLPSKNRTKINSRWKQSRSSFKNTLLRQLSSRLLKHERSSSNPRATDINKPDSRQLFTNSELPENDSDPEEWIPPSATKLLQPAVFSNLKTVGLQARRPAICKHMADELVCENKGSSGTDRHLISRAEILKTPTLTCATKAFLLEDAAPGACFCSEIESSLSCAIDSRGILDIAGNWSPELFTENFQAQKLVFPKPVS
ncbi:DNA damage-induced apoptosis suppressor protein isoform X1 [Alligator mississippiensis]|uniref:DNA damage-induced apoptosis suppressor protein isoform X1 n=1 Tax=Alligator mississippiensis TaxID=8496 RepID=UPI002878150C|nr:DNA damage-induced apoptosis suppressor protein isoform X1 [Alligator mississippiensis]